MIYVWCMWQMMLLLSGIEIYTQHIRHPCVQIGSNMYSTWSFLWSWTLPPPKSRGVDHSLTLCQECLKPIYHWLCFELEGGKPYPPPETLFTLVLPLPYPTLSNPLIQRCLLFHKSVTEVSKTKLPKHVGPFGKCSLWDDYTSGHNAAARLAAGGLRAFIAEILPRRVYS